MNQPATTLYSFCFSHHGQFSSFHRLLHYAQNCRTLDVTLPLASRLTPTWRRRLDYRWLRLNEWRLRPTFKKSTRQCVHYFYPENSLFHGWEWKGPHGLILSCHQPPSQVQSLKEAGHVNFFKGMAAADKVVLLSQNFATGYEAYCDKSKIESIPHGVDTHFFQPSFQPPKQPMVLTIGNWLRDYDLWASVVLRLADEMPDVHFTVVAWPELVRKAQGRVAHLGRRVRFLQGLSDEQLRQLYHDASVLFLPLHDAGANNALLEAMASGVPLMVSDLSATREYAGNCAVFFRHDSMEKCASQLTALLKNQSQRIALAAAARQRAIECFSWEVIAARYARLYSEVMG